MLSQMQDFHFALFELHEAPDSRFLQAVQGHLNSRLALQCISHFLSSGILCELAKKIHLNNQVFDKDIKQ